MKNSLTIKVNVLIATLICLSSAFSFAQAPDWNSHGTRADSSSLLGTSNYNDLKIITDSTVRITIDKDGVTSFENNLIVNRSIKTDTLLSDSNLTVSSNLDLPLNWIHADSLRCRIIHVGDSSLIIGGTNFNTGNNNTIISNPGTFGLELISQSANLGNNGNFELLSANGRIILGRNFSTIPDVNVGIGIQNPAAYLHIHRNNLGLFALNPNCVLFTHGSTSTNGVEIGLMGNGDGIITHHGNNPLKFSTNDLQRMTILNTGLVGINETTPTSIFQITEATGAEQLKLSFDVNTRTTLRTTAAGHLIIWPRKNNNIDGRVAIWGGINNAGYCVLPMHYLITNNKGKLQHS